eukprot:scaffold61699_cov23-Phaeocystis_antarctica.AAC.1
MSSRPTTRSVVATRRAAAAWSPTLSAPAGSTAEITTASPSASSPCSAAASQCGTSAAAALPSPPPAPRGAARSHDGANGSRACD